MQLFVSGETFILIKNDQPVDTCIQSLLTTSYKPKTLCHENRTEGFRITY